MTREVAAEYDEWPEKSILDRTKKLAEKALIIWPIPDLPQSKDTELLSGEYPIEEIINVTDCKPDSIIIETKEIKVDSWTSMLVEFLNFVWQLDSATFENLKEKEGPSRLFNTSEKRGLKVLDNGMTVTTNFSANNIFAMIRVISKEYEIEEDVSYTIK